MYAFYFKMKSYTLLLSSILISSINSLIIDRFYCTLNIFGDSLSDYNNLYDLSKSTLPDPSFYYNGRYSNGLTWVEYLSQQLIIKHINNFSYAGATTDNVEFQPTLIKGGVPGAIQQVENYAKVASNNKCLFLNNELSIIAFGGNDFKLPNSSPNKMVDNIDKAIRTLIEKHNLKEFLIMTSTPLDISPSVKILPQAYQQQFTNIVNAIEMLWNQKLEAYKQQYPNVKFYTFNPRAYVLDIIQKKVTINNVQGWETDKPCLDRKFNSDGTISNTTNICNNPQNYIFWDEIHPTTNVHKYVANKVMKVIGA